MGKGQVFQVGEQQCDRTLAAALRMWLPGMTWSQIRRLIYGRRVLVSGNVCVEEARRLRRQDVVKVLEQPVPREPTVDDVKVEYFDRQVCVVYKPPGMNSIRHADELVGRRVQFQPALTELLPRILKRLDARLGSQRSWPPVFPVHRLDRDTAGLMVFARTRAAQHRLAEQFRVHAVHRVYRAVVHGRIKDQTIESFLVRDRGDGRRGSTTKAGEGVRAVTHVRVLEYIGPFSVVECRLETGRTHQIRIHLSEAGHVLCGEKIYRKPLRGPVVEDRSGSPRLALHAAELGFFHPKTGQWLQFHSEWPGDLAGFLADLRRRYHKEGSEN